jgi:hypothetical protein
VAAPTVTGLGTTTGPTTGGTVVQITGTNFNNPNVSVVSFGGVGASFLINSATQITAFSPPHVAGAAEVRVTNGDGTSGAGTNFTYTSSAPTITNLVGTSGPTTGGTAVVIVGTNFSKATGVSFGGVGATFVINSPTTITAFSPPHAAGAVNVVVTNADGNSNSATFTYGALTPSVSGVVNPSTGLASGTVAGGIAVQIGGSNLSRATVVSFGGVSATFLVNSDISITAFLPPHATGAVHVQVTNPDGSSTVGGTGGGSDVFTYN